MLSALRFLILVLLAYPALAADGADEAAAWAALRQGGHVALMRHADAPGVGDPVDYRLDDCTTQRNLSDRGRQRAAAVGLLLRQAAIAPVSLRSSPWCRCRDTARLLGIGPEVVEPGFSNMFVLRDQRSALEAEGGRLIRGWRGPETLFVVTHGANIQALIGYHPAEAEIVLVKATTTGDLQVLGRIPPPP